MSADNLITGPESLTPGHFYHHAGLRGILYFAACNYWQDPATGAREPQPGSEAMYSLNGDLPGAQVIPPLDEGGSEEFWHGFYPAPGLLACEAILDGVASVMGQVKVIEDNTHEPEIAAVADTAIGSLQRVARTVKQIGHVNYAEARPIEIQAKDRTIGLYVDQINNLIEGLTLAAKRAVDLANRLPAGTHTHSALVELANDAALLTHVSPYHKKP